MEINFPKNPLIDPTSESPKQSSGDYLEKVNQGYGLSANPKRQQVPSLNLLNLTSILNEP